MIEIEGEDNADNVRSSLDGRMCWVKREEQSKDSMLVEVTTTSGRTAETWNFVLLNREVIV